MVPGVCRELPTDHLCVLGKEPIAVRVEGGVHADESLSLVPDERHELLFLLVAEAPVPRGVHGNDRIEIIEIPALATSTVQTLRIARPPDPSFAGPGDVGSERRSKISAQSPARRSPSTDAIRSCAHGRKQR
jgi:hypothetical protein